MATKTKKIRALKNAIFNVAGDKTSGLLEITDLQSAQTFLNRFDNGTYTVTDPAVIADLTEGDKPAVLSRNGRAKTTVQGTVVNGALEVPEVWVKQGNGYDFYVNNVGGFMRKDTPREFDPQTLGKIILVSLQTLHSHAASENEAIATDANRVLNAVRSYDGVAAEAAAQRQAADKRAKALQTLLDANVPQEQAEAILNQANGNGVVTPIEPAPVDVVDENLDLLTTGNAPVAHNKKKGKKAAEQPLDLEVATA